MDGRDNSVAVVLIDDDDMLRDGWSLNLKGMGYDVVASLTPEQALVYDWVSCPATVALVDAFDARFSSHRDGDFLLTASVIHQLRRVRPEGAEALRDLPVNGDLDAETPAPLAVIVLSLYADNPEVKWRFGAGADSILSRVQYPTAQALAPLLERPWEAAALSTYRHTEQDEQLLQERGLKHARVEEIVRRGQATRITEFGPILHGNAVAPRKAVNERLYERWIRTRDHIVAAGISKPIDYDLRSRAPLRLIREAYGLLRGAELREKHVTPPPPLGGGEWPAPPDDGMPNL